MTAHPEDHEMEGFVFGLAVFVTVSQLPKLFGVEKGTGDTIAQFVHLLGHLGDTNGASVAIGASMLALLFAVDRMAARIPGGLLALVLGIVLSSLLNLPQHGVEIVGHVPSGLPTPTVPSINGSDAAALVAAAGGMLLVIFSESLGAAENFAAKHGYDIDPNQELIALGVANAGGQLLLLDQRIDSQRVDGAGIVDVDHHAAATDRQRGRDRSRTGVRHA